TFLTLIVAHFKASDGSANENARNLSAQDIMSWVGSRAADKNVLLLGDLNLGFSGEAAWQTLIANSNPSLSFRDPINKLTGWGGASNASLHTQSTRASGSGCFVGGGLDDRFDFILASNEVIDGSQGATYQSGSYDALGNDGTDFNQGIVCNGNTSVPGAVCQALFNTSDHLPVVLTLEMGGGATSGLPDWSSAIRVGPQPVLDQLYVAVDESLLKGRWQLTLHDAYGRTLFNTEGTPSWQVSLGNWPAGVYLLEIIDPKGRSLQQKVLKVRL
ncbi:MAG: T9SS type A sorting domain-containing protein, partial [Bacteroidota bacterium]